MSLRKLWFLSGLAIIIGFVVIRTLNVPAEGFLIMTLQSPPHDPALTTVGSALHTLPRRNPDRWNGHETFRANSENESPVFLPMQSKDAKNLRAGSLLVASRNLSDPTFAETVILLVHYDAEGVVGMILNRRTNIPLSRVLDGIKAAKNRSDPVYLGGPLETPAVFALLHSTTKPEGAEQIFAGVYLILKKDLFEKIISARPDNSTCHVYLGYAGWNPDQLRREVQLGAWFIFQADAKTIFDSDPDSLWRGE